MPVLMLNGDVICFVKTLLKRETVCRFDTLLMVAFDLRGGDAQHGLYCSI